ncbi:hypothetical protein Javan64_0055 [Streptococcus phage Javan64]|nr:hypothetical protein Javan64_0055 [Streptococcus phage Javan64]
MKSRKGKRKSLDFSKVIKLVTAIARLIKILIEIIKALS